MASTSNGSGEGGYREAAQRRAQEAAEQRAQAREKEAAERRARREAIYNAKRDHQERQAVVGNGDQPGRQFLPPLTHTPPSRTATRLRVVSRVWSGSGQRLAARRHRVQTEPETLILHSSVRGPSASAPAGRTILDQERIEAANKRAADAEQLRVASQRAAATARAAARAEELAALCAAKRVLEEQEACDMAASARALRLRYFFGVGLAGRNKTLPTPPRLGSPTPRHTLVLQQERRRPWTAPGKHTLRDVEAKLGRESNGVPRGGAARHVSSGTCSAPKAAGEAACSVGGVGHLRGAQDLPSAELRRLYESAYKRRAGVIDGHRERRRKAAARAANLARNAAARQRREEAARQRRIDWWREQREGRRMATEDACARAMRAAARAASTEMTRRAWLRAAHHRLCPKGGAPPSHRCGRVKYLAHLGLKRIFGRQQHPARPKPGMMCELGGGGM